MVRISGVENDSIVDGEGLRLAIFFQGCPHQCKGCHNPETWDEKGGELVHIGNLYLLMRDNPLLDGITLTGGEPFVQPWAVAKLSHHAHLRGLTVWCYTGYRWEELMKAGFGEYMNDIDVLVDGRFERANRSLDLRFRGSRNQRVIDVKESLKYGCVVEHRL